MIMKIIKGLLYGLIFGLGSPVPGVSAGTVAILLNVYDRFFSTISVAMVRKNLLFTIMFLGGWVLGLFGISSLMMYLLENHGQIIFYSFIGLILGCLPIIFQKAVAKKIRPISIAVFVAALSLMYFLAFYGDDISANQTLAELGGQTPTLLAWIFVASTISSMAMLIPGVGGSLMMLVFGIYAIYIEAISNLDMTVLLVFGISMVLGVLLGIVGTKKLLEKNAEVLYFAVLGFIIGSLFILYPGHSFDITGLISVIALVLSAGFSYWLSKQGGGM